MLIRQGKAHRMKMKLTADVGVIGGGNFRFNLSAPLDCRIDILDGGTS